MSTNVSTLTAYQTVRALNKLARTADPQPAAVPASVPGVLSPTARKRLEGRRDLLSSTKTMARWIVLAGIVASVVANSIGSETPIEVGFAAVPPLSLFGAIELLIRVQVVSRFGTVVRVLGTLAVALASGWLSYFRMASAASEYGREHGVNAYVWPISVDGLMVVAAVSLVAIDGLIREIEARLDESDDAAKEAADAATLAQRLADEADAAQRAQARAADKLSAAEREARRLVNYNDLDRAGKAGFTRACRKHGTREAVRMFTAPRPERTPERTTVVGIDATAR